MREKTRQIDYYGIDTETYTIGGEGLLSIQIHGKNGSVYIGPDEEMITFDDEDIRALLLDEFFWFLDNLRNDSIFYFFNLRFDFSQMEKYFVTRYELTDELVLKKGQASILQSPTQVYQVRFRTINGGRVVTFVDLFNLTQSSLDRSVKEFVDPEAGKHTLASKEFLKAIPTKAQRAYAEHDAVITYNLAMALKDIHGFDLTTNITIGARTLALFKDMISSRKRDYDIAGHKCYLPGHWAADLWSYFGFTEDDLPLFEAAVRSGVRGGVTQAFQVGKFDDCVHVDISSAHPSQMVKAIPYGVMLDKKPEAPHTYLAYPDGFFTLKKGGLKVMQFRNKADCLRYEHLHELKPAEYVESFLLDGSFGIWADEYELLLSQYDYDGITTYKYWKTRHDDRLTALVTSLYDGKGSSQGARRTVYKYLLNALYGKFLTRPDGMTIEYEFKNDGTVKRVPTQDDGRKTVNVVLGSWIAMMTRVQLLTTCLSLPRDCLLYSDTDSIIFKRFEGWEKVIPLGTGLGEWGLESEPESVLIVGPKTYQELIDGRTHTKCAGLSRGVSAQIPYGDLCEGYAVMRLKAERNKETLAIRLVERQFIVTAKPTPYLGGH